MVSVLIRGRPVIGKQLRNMEGRKKSSKKMLEEKQMKRYFRSIKRSKGKNRKEINKTEGVVKEENKQVNVVASTTIRTDAEKPENTKESRQTSSEDKKNIMIAFLVMSQHLEKFIPFVLL